MILVQVATATDEEWGAYLVELGKAAKAGANLLVIAAGPGPTAPQRRALKNVGLPASLHTAVVSASPVARMMTKILGWVHPNMFAFTPAEMDEAFNRLGVPLERRKDALEQIASMRAELSGSSADPAR